MNRQQLVEKVIQFYKSGGRPGFDGDNCVYQGPLVNQRCAIGCLVKRAGDLQSFQSDTVANIMAIWRRAHEYERQDIIQQIADILPDDLDEEMGLAFLSQMQSIHDNCPMPLAEEDGEEYQEEMARFITKLESGLLRLIGHERSTEAVSAG